MLYVVKPAGPVSDRLDTVLAYALAGTEYCVVTTVAELTAYCRRGSVKKILFAVSLGYGGINLAYAELAAYLALEKDVLQHTCGGVLIDGDSELFTKKVGRELIFLANRAGCLFPGKPLVEATGTLANFAVQAALQGVDTLQAYKLSARRLVRKVTAFSPAPVSAENVLALHASSRSTSNTLLLWEWCGGICLPRSPSTRFRCATAPSWIVAGAAMKRVFTSARKVTASMAGSLSIPFILPSKPATSWF